MIVHPPRLGPVRHRPCPWCGCATARIDPRSMTLFDFLVVCSNCGRTLRREEVPKVPAKDA